MWEWERARKTSTGENGSRIINVYWNAVDHLSNISFSVAHSPLQFPAISISFSLSLLILFYFLLLSLATYRSLFRRRRLLFNCCEFIFFNVAFTRVYCLYVAKRILFCSSSFLLLLALLSFHSFSLNGNDRKKSIHSNLIQVLCFSFRVWIIFVCLFVCLFELLYERNLCIETECKH